jgi:hypothetical protein
LASSKKNLAIGQLGETIKRLAKRLLANIKEKV